MSIILNILKEINKSDDLLSLIIELEKDKDLGSKATLIKAYSDLYIDFYGQDLFKKFGSQTFTPLIRDASYVVKNHIID